MLKSNSSPQPLQSEEEIQAAFLDWLHTQSHEPLACLTPRSGKILFHADDGDPSFHFTLRPMAVCLKSAPKHQSGDTQTALSISSVAKLEFVLSVLKPEAENDPPDQLFLLSPAVIQKNIQVNNQPLLRFSLVIQCIIAGAHNNE